MVCASVDNGGSTKLWPLSCGVMPESPPEPESVESSGKADCCTSAAITSAFDSVLPQPVRHKAPANNSVLQSLYLYHHGPLLWGHLEELPHRLPVLLLGYQCACKLLMGAFGCRNLNRCMSLRTTSVPENLSGYPLVGCCYTYDTQSEDER